MLLKVNSDYFLICDILVELCNSVQVCFLLGGNQFLLHIYVCVCIYYVHARELQTWPNGSAVNMSLYHFDITCFKCLSLSVNFCLKIRKCWEVMLYGLVEYL